MKGKTFIFLPSIFFNEINIFLTHKRSKVREKCYKGMKYYEDISGLDLGHDIMYKGG